MSAPNSGRSSTLAALGLALGLGLGCADPGPAAEASDTGTTQAEAGETGTEAPACEPGEDGFPRVHDFDPEQASLGQTIMRSELGEGLIPRLALDNMWLAWGEPPYADLDAYWAEFRRRYGLVEAPWANDGLPIGLHMVDGQLATLDCLFCHSDRIAGQTLVGAGSGAVDFQGFYDDLVTLNELAPMFNIPSLPLPWSISGRTQAAGATDAYGLGMELSQAYGPDEFAPTTEFGFTHPAPWWQLALKQRTYADGSGQAAGHRTMAAMTLAFGWSYAELMTLDGELEAMHHFMRSIEAPPWPFDAPDPTMVTRGREHYDNVCATCHGDTCGEDAAYPNRIVDFSQVGTDPDRGEPFGATEVAWINGSWFGQDHPVEDTDGYLAPPLIGIWASAPYFHNGSVPTVEAVLDPSLRPTRWRRLGSELDDYDPEALGLRVEILDEPVGQATIEARKVYDTTAPGLSNAGHEFGGTLDADARAELLAFLSTL